MSNIRFNSIRWIQDEQEAKRSKKKRDEAR